MENHPELQSAFSQATQKLEELALCSETALRGNQRDYDGVQVDLSRYVLPDANGINTTRPAAMIYPIWRGSAGNYTTLGSWPLNNDRSLADLISDNPDSIIEINEIGLQVETIFSDLEAVLSRIDSRVSVFFEGASVDGAFKLTTIRLNDANCVVDQRADAGSAIAAIAASQIASILSHYSDPADEMQDFKLKRPFRLKWDKSLKKKPLIHLAATAPNVRAPNAECALMTAQVSIQSLIKCGIDIGPAEGKDPFRVK